MTLYDLLTNSGTYGALVVVLFLFEVSPIPINPWSSIAKFFGRAINGELIKKVDNLQNAVEEIKENHKKFEKGYGEDKATERRIRIIGFNDEILHHIDHSKEHYDQILEDITEYNEYCRTHPEFKNSKAVFAIQNIQRKNQEHFDNNSYL